MNPNSISLRQKLGCVIFGIFLSLVALELILRFTGAIILSFREHKNIAAAERKGVFRIVAFGGSTTAPEYFNGTDFSYPAQLGKILNRKNKEIRFEVINKGIAGVDSAYILSNLEDNLNKYNPDMVIIMTGINDSVSTVAYRDSFSAKMELFLKSFRIYKLFKLYSQPFAKAVKRFGRRPGEKSAVNTLVSQNHAYQGKTMSQYLSLFHIYQTKSDYSRAGEILKEALRLWPKDKSLYTYLADMYTDIGRYDDSKNTLKQALKIYPRDIGLQMHLVRAYIKQGEMTKAKALLQEAAAESPGHYALYRQLFNYCKEQNDMQELKKICEKNISLGCGDEFLLAFAATAFQLSGDYAKADSYYRRAEELRLKYYNSKTRHNYRVLKNTVLAKGIKLVLVQYPVRSLEPLKKIFISTKGVIFVDNERIFKKALAKKGYGHYFSDNFAGDFGHCTPEGNRLLAENIAAAILKKYFR